jgi:hypothetical protein
VRAGLPWVPIRTRIGQALCDKRAEPGTLIPKLGLLVPAVEFLMTGMRDVEKDRLALSVADRHSEFEGALAGNGRKYPTREFRLFAEAVRRYVEKTRSDKMMHRDVVGAVHGLVDFLRVERRRVPGSVLFEAERLECLLFLGYDPHFDGDEPPGL